MFLPALFPEIFYVRKLGYSGGFRALIEGGGGIFIYSGSAQLISFETRLISKEISRAEHEYMNMRPQLTL